MYFTDNDDECAALSVHLKDINRKGGYAHGIQLAHLIKPRPLKLYSNRKKLDSTEEQLINRADQ